MNSPIIFFDSGIGGLPYLVHLRDRIPWENFIYVADSKNFPYGDKSEDLLKKIITETIGNIINEFKPKVIVLACNTASVTALNELRQSTKVPIVGVVPAIKTAASVTKNNKIGILATNRTAGGEYLKNLIKKFSSGKDVYPVGASDIVNFVERDYFSATKESVDSFISRAVSALKEHDVDSVVLGCTHFIHVAGEISVALGNNITVIDSREGVSNQTERVIVQKTDRNMRGFGHFYITKKIDDCRNYRSLCRDSKLEFKGEFRS